MAASNRLILIKIHMLLAAFIFPAALMFLVTGGLYTWEFKGSYEPEVFRIELEAPLGKDADLLAERIKAELDSRSIAYPSGKGKVKSSGTSFMYEWTGSKRDVVLEPTDDARIAQLMDESEANVRDCRHVGTRCDD